MFHRSQRGLVILHQDAVPERGEVGRPDEFLALETRGREDDVVGLPLARLSRHVDQRRRLTVNGAGDAVGIDQAVVRLDDLQFVLAEEQDAAVAPVHRSAVGLRGRGPLDVQLTIAEVALGADLARLADVDRAVLDSAGLSAGPLVEVAAVEQHDRVGGRLSGFAARNDQRRLRAVTVVNPPLRAGQERRVRVAGTVRGEEVGGEQQNRGLQDEVAKWQGGDVTWHVRTPLSFGEDAHYYSMGT